MSIKQSFEYHVENIVIRIRIGSLSLTAPPKEPGFKAPARKR